MQILKLSLSDFLLSGREKLGGGYTYEQSHLGKTKPLPDPVYIWGLRGIFAQVYILGKPHIKNQSCDTSYLAESSGKY